MITNDVHKYLDAALLLNLFEQSPVAMSLYDRSGLQVAINKAQAVLFGMNPVHGHFW